MGRRTVLGFVFMLLSSLCFAVSGPLAKMLYGIGWTPGAVVVVRLSGAALLLLAPVAATLCADRVQILRGWRTIVGYGIAAMAGVQAFFFLALEHLSVAVAVLLEMMGAPLIIVFWLWARAGRRPSVVTGIGAGVCLAGVLLVLDLRGARASWAGVLLAIAAAACMAVYFALSSSGRVTLPPVGFAGLGMGVGALAAGVATVTGLMPARFGSSDVHLAGQRAPWYAPVLLLVVLTAGAYVLGILGTRLIGRPWAHSWVSPRCPSRPLPHGSSCRRP